MPVNCLNTFTQDWTLKVKVMKKYELKHWNNQRGSGNILNLDLMDASNTMITATFYNEAAIKWNELIQEGRVYKMANGNVKLANKRYTTIPHDHCLVFDTYSTIEEINEEKARKSIMGNMFNFTSLEVVASSSHLFIIDVIGVITSAEPTA